MRHWFHPLMGLFFILLVLFYASEFTIFSSIPGSSSLKLLSQREALAGPKKVILVVIDSLRYDYIQRLPFVSAALQSKPSKTFLVKCRVGNPTMTTQRIESLMTGSEIFSSTTILKSFFASRTSTDSIIHQLNLQNRSSFVMGDDTWIKLFNFAGGETCSNTYNVHDYDSCDQSIYENMIEEITNKPTHDLIVSHFLALDHIGHSTSNIHNQLMDAKMRRISGFIERVMWEMANDTLLLVTGDHGMRQDGNHGGSTESQAYTFLFGYNKLVDFSGLRKGQTISQPDITATLSLYLDTPIPLNSVGTPIIQAMPSNFIQNRSIAKEVYSNLVSHFNMMSQYYTPHVQKIGLLFPQELKNEQLLEIVDRKLSECTSRLEFLKYSTPNETVNKIILVSLSLVSISIVVQVLRINPHNLRQHINRLPNLVSLLTKLAVGSMLFMAYFSWYLIQNLSNLYLVFLMAFIIVICFDNKDAGISDLDQQIVTIVMLIFSICQIEPSKSSQYKPNAMKLRLFQTLLDSITIRCILVSAIFFQYWRKTLDLKMDKYARYMMMPLLALSQLNYILTYCAHIEPYIIRTLILLLVMGLTIYSIFKGIWDPQAATISFSLLILLFLGENGPIIIYFCCSITRILVRLQVSPLFFGFLSEFLWWLMGNRFEYSGIDVVKSYIFSADYHPILNGVCILIIVISPHLTLFVHMSILMAGQKTGQKDYTSIVSNQQAQQLDDKQKDGDVSDLQSMQMQEFILVPLLGLLSSAWNVDYNNSKILFTVVYLPMLLFSLIKIIAAYAMIALAHLFSRK